MTVAKVGQICKQVRGVSYKKADASSSPQDGYSPILRANNIADGMIVPDDLVYVPDSKISAVQRLRPNDVVIATSSGSISVVGKAAQSRNGWNGAFGAFCKVLRPSDEVDPIYFGHYFRTPDYRRTVSSLAAGANINNLKNEHLDGLDIYLPPLEEQKRIARILDEADALRAKRRESIEQLDALLQSIFLDMFGDTATNPRAWETITLGNLLRVKSGKGLAAKDMDPNGNHPVYGGNGVNGHHSDYMFEEPKVVIGRVGVYCGAVHQTQPKSWVTDNALFVDEVKRPINNTYLLHALGAADLNQYASQAAQPLISGGRIYPVPILYPPMSAQERFSQLATVHGAQRARLHGHLSELNTLFASLQSRAFNGQL